MVKRKKIIDGSQRRSRRFGLDAGDPRLRRSLTVNELDQRSEANRLLINAAAPYMHFAAETFKKCNSLLVLLDRDGFILKVFGPRKIVEARKKIGLKEGVSLREEDVGTTAANIALRHRIPFYIKGKEYFLKIFQKGACFAAPVIPSKKLLGAIVIVHPEKRGLPHTFTLSQTLAKLIEQEYRSLSESDFVISVCNTLNAAVVVTDPTGMILYHNQRAGELLKVHKGQNILVCFNENLLAQKDIINEVFHSSRLQRRFLVGRRKYHDKYLFVLEPVEEEIEKSEKLRSTMAQYTFDDIIGLADLKREAKHLAFRDVNLLITGESGTGKELFASAIHNESSRSSGRFVAINCSAIPESLFESELFGYKKGAFTDARNDRVGKIEYANGGTLFLDEVGDLPMEVQGKLLRVLETRKVARLGGNEEMEADVRFIFATNKDLEQMVKHGRFREDLFYRINSPGVHIPPLRERRGEIPELTERTFLKFKKTYKLFIEGIAPEAISALIKYDFPGNVRELEGILKQAYLTCKKNLIQENDLGLKKEAVFTFDQKVTNFKARLVHEAFLVNNKDIKKTSAALNLSERQVYRYLKKVRDLDSSIVV